MRLTKHHGLGNDFLVLLDLDGTRPVSPAEAAALCDRRTGLGADGLLRATGGTPAPQVTMELLNADGSSGRDERQRHPLPRPGGVPGRARRAAGAHRGHRRRPADRARRVDVGSDARTA